MATRREARRASRHSSPRRRGAGERYHGGLSRSEGNGVSGDMAMSSLWRQAGGVGVEPGSQKGAEQSLQDASHEDRQGNNQSTENDSRYRGARPR